MRNTKICCALFAAVQEERQRNKEQGREEVESTSSAQNDMSVERILEAEIAAQPTTQDQIVQSADAASNFTQAADKQLFCLVEWAKRIPHFTTLHMDDQILLMRSGNR